MDLMLSGCVSTMYPHHNEGLVINHPVANILKENKALLHIKSMTASCMSGGRERLDTLKKNIHIQNICTHILKHIWEFLPKQKN